MGTGGGARGTRPAEHRPLPVRAPHRALELDRNRPVSLLGRTPGGAAQPARVVPLLAGRAARRLRRDLVVVPAPGATDRVPRGLAPFRGGGTGRAALAGRTPGGADRATRGPVCGPHRCRAA